MTSLRTSIRNGRYGGAPCLSLLVLLCLCAGCAGGRKAPRQMALTSASCFVEVAPIQEHPRVYVGDASGYAITACICPDGSARIDALSSWHKDGKERKHIYVGRLYQASHVMSLRESTGSDDVIRTAVVEVRGDRLFFDRLPLWSRERPDKSTAFSLKLQELVPREISRQGALVCSIAKLSWIGSRDMQDDIVSLLEKVQIDCVVDFSPGVAVAILVLQRDCAVAKSIVQSYKAQHPERDHLEVLP